MELEIACETLVRLPTRVNQAADSARCSPLTPVLSPLRGEGGASGDTRQATSSDCRSALSRIERNIRGRAILDAAALSPEWGEGWRARGGLAVDGLNAAVFMLAQSFRRA